MLSQEQRRALSALEEIVDHHQELWAEGDPNPLQAQFLVREVAAWAARLIGLDVVRRAYGMLPEDADRADHLAALSSRIEMVAPFFKTADPSHSDGSLPAAAREIAALAAGDVAILFDRVGRGPKSSEGIVSYRLAEFQLRALYWAEVFKLNGVKPGQFQSWISEAFGHLTWDAIRKWKAEVIERLGEKAYRGRMSLARIEADLDRRMSRTFDQDEARRSLQRDGQAFNRLRRFRPRDGTGHS